jgi:diacylglycerol kinase family enzyme
MDVTLLLKASAGRGAHSADELRRVVAAAGHRVEIWSAKGEELRRALEHPRELVVVAGGDGTVGRVSKALAGRGVPLAILPLGTANNIATSLGICGTPAELARRWASAARLRVDVGSARGPWGEARFIESVGVGLLGKLLAPEVGDEIEDTEVARETARHLARSMPAAYHRVELDGEDLSGEYLLLEAMNIRCAGPNLWLADHARADDGRLEIVLAKESDRATLVALADAFASSPALLPTLSGRRLRIWCEPEDLHIDDRHGRALSEGHDLAQVDVELTEQGVDFLV